MVKNVSNAIFAKIFSARFPTNLMQERSSGLMDGPRLPSHTLARSVSLCSLLSQLTPLLVLLLLVVLFVIVSIARWWLPWWWWFRSVFSVGLLMAHVMFQKHSSSPTLTKITGIVDTDVHGENSNACTTVLCDRNVAIVFMLVTAYTRIIPFVYPMATYSFAVESLTQEIDSSTTGSSKCLPGSAWRASMIL